MLAYFFLLASLRPIWEKIEIVVQQVSIILQNRLRLPLLRYKDTTSNTHSSVVMLLWLYNEFLTSQWAEYQRNLYIQNYLMLVQIDWVLRRMYSRGKYKYRFVIGRFGGTLNTHMTFSQRWASRQRFPRFTRPIFHFPVFSFTFSCWGVQVPLELLRAAIS